MELEGDDVELEQLDEDHVRRAHRHLVDGEVMDVVGDCEDAVAEETTVAPILPKEAMQRHPSILEEEACSTRMNVIGAKWIMHIG